MATQYPIESPAWDDRLRGEILTYLEGVGQRQSELSREIGRAHNYITKALRASGPLSAKFITALATIPYWSNIEQEYHLAKLAAASAPAEREEYRDKAWQCYADRYAQMVQMAHDAVAELENNAPK